MTEKYIVGDRFRVFLMAVRQAIIISLGALEDYLEIPRSIIPRRKRENKND
jgi:hypothetical protein